MRKEFTCEKTTLFIATRTENRNEPQQEGQIS